MMLFSGLYIRRAQIPGYWIWVHWCSVFKYSLEAVVANQVYFSYVHFSYLHVIYFMISYVWGYPLFISLSK